MERGENEGTGRGGGRGKIKKQGKCVVGISTYYLGLDGRMRRKGKEEEGGRDGLICTSSKNPRKYSSDPKGVRGRVPVGKHFCAISPFENASVGSNFYTKTIYWDKF